MSILTALKSALLPDVSPRRERAGTARRSALLNRYYEAAKPDRLLDSHYAHANTTDATTAVSADFKVLRNRVRYEIRNNSYAAGMMDTLANDVVGPGPTLNFDDGNEQIENNFAQWSRHSNYINHRSLGDLLRQTIKCLLQDGEAFYWKRYDRRGELRLFPIDADRIDTPLTQLANNNIVDGIELDKDGMVINYHVLNYHPGDGLTAKMDYSSTVIPASEMLHVFRADRPGQHRGIPWLAPSIGLFAMLRDFGRATLKAANRAALISFVLETTQAELMDAEELTSPETYDEIEMPEDAGLTLPEGWTAKQFKSENPNSTYEMFVRMVMNEAARCINMPLNIAMCNSSNYNYSSGQLDHLTYHRSIEVIRQMLEELLLNPVTIERLRLLQLVPGMMSINTIGEPINYDWYWTNRGYADPVKHATAQKISLENGTTTLSKELAACGLNPNRVIKQQGKELKIKKKSGLVDAITEADIASDAFTINEIRKQRGYKPIDGGDVPPSQFKAAVATKEDLTDDASEENSTDDAKQSTEASKESNAA